MKEERFLRQRPNALYFSVREKYQKRNLIAVVML
jgi:hypothetical protein